MGLKMLQCVTQELIPYITIFEMKYSGTPLLGSTVVASNISLAQLFCEKLKLHAHLFSHWLMFSLSLIGQSKLNRQKAKVHRR